MKVLVNSGGNVTWDNTRTTTVTSAAFSMAPVDFGVGPEHSAICPGCNRRLPTFCMHLDHILPQARHTQSLAMPGQELALHSSIHPHAVSTAYVGKLNGGLANISILGALSQSLRLTVQIPRIPLNVINTRTLWENDLNNLQFICGGCNSRKGNKDFDVVFNGAHTRPLGGFVP